MHNIFVPSQFGIETFIVDNYIFMYGVGPVTVVKKRVFDPLLNYCLYSVHFWV